MKHLTCLLCALLALTAHARQPNIIFILADDLGPGDLGCYGQKIIRTPNIDRIAAEGMRFTRHYSGNAVCAPSRCVLMTGLHPGHTYIRDNRQADNAKGFPRMGKPEHEGQFPIPDAAVTLAEVFKSLNYTTGGFGKWGLGGPGSTGEPLKQGFDRWFGYNCQGVAHNYYPTYLWDNDKAIDLKNPPFLSNDKLQPGEDPAKPESYQRFKGSEYSADLIAEQALKFARENKDRPFFIFWPTTVPHVALQVPDDSLQEYIGKFDDPPYAGGNGYLPHFQPKAAYAAMITRMDAEIGRMMALIAELGLDDDTLFVFTSDNGPLSGTHEGLAGTDCAFFNSNQGLRDGKGTLYEGGFRAPCVVRWKGKIKAGVTSDRVTGFEDWMPTLAELAGGKDHTPAHTDGISFAPTLLGEKQPAREFLYREFLGYGGQQMLLMGDWKLLRMNLATRPANAKSKAKGKGKPMSEELYNITTDPTETRNVIAENPDLVAKMKKLMAAQHMNSADFPMTALDH
ncbi:MAG: arylsulfatase [Verrucomicrobiaceae bacterium]|nr:arylsulfatase [Verrucomicrobiaceae bacterium]